ncbi:M14-type cytosolic carboxypeptidase [Parashewanella spongiae]|nr:M14-type cytosolic carboxypeptidase [Parashewanella spongiae]
MPKWRNWWYMKFEGIPTNRNYRLVINDLFEKQNPGWQHPYTPVYSYDKRHWKRFEPNEVSQQQDTTNTQIKFSVTMSKTFTQKSVWIARFYPYTNDDLNLFYKRLLSQNPNLKTNGYFVKSALAWSPTHNLPIDMITITNPAIAPNHKKRIWIQARSRASDSGSSFVAEGIISWLLDETNNDASNILDNFIIHIVPMQNVDGVFDGNYLLNSRTQNLDNLWYPQGSNPLFLSDGAPKENLIINSKIRELLDQPGKFNMAINLHSAQTQQQTRAFFYPHFGKKSHRYTSQQTNLWNNSIRFVNSVREHYGKFGSQYLIEPNPRDGGKGFSYNSSLESWWWKNFHDQVTAITLNTTNDHAGFQPEYVTPDRLRKLGGALMLGILEYNHLPTIDNSLEPALTVTNSAND